MFRGVSAISFGRKVFGGLVFATALAQGAHASAPLSGDDLLLIQSLARTQVEEASANGGVLDVQTAQDAVSRSSCSGFVIQTASGAKMAVSAAHCDSQFHDTKSGVVASLILQKAKSSGAGVEADTLFEVRGNPFRIGFGQDVALLGIPGEAFTSTTSLPLTKSAVLPQERLFVGGFPRGQGPVLASCVNLGPVLSEEIPQGSRSNVDVWIECPAFRGGPGNGGISGGPVVNGRGEVVGILVREKQIHMPSGQSISAGLFMVTPLSEDNIDLERGYVPHTYDGQVTLPFLDQEQIHPPTTAMLKDGRIEGVVRVTRSNGSVRSKLFKDGRKFAELDTL